MEGEGKGGDIVEAKYDEDYDPSLAFRVLEEDFQQIMQELERNDRLGHFSNEFQRFFDALKESHAKEKELLEKNKALNSQIAANASKVAAALKLSQADQETIEKLKQEIEAAWKMVDAAHTREQHSQETLENLRQQVSRLSQEIEASKKLGADQDQEAGNLAKNKEAMAREKERLMNEVANAKERLSNQLKYQEDLEKKNEAAEAKISELSTDLEAQKNELAKEKRFKEKLEEEIKELKSELSNKDMELQGQSLAIQQNTRFVSKLEHNLREQRVANEKVNKDLQDLSNSQRMIKIEYEQQLAENEKLNQLLIGKNQDLKLKEEEIAKLRIECGRIQKSKEAVEKKIHHMDVMRANLEEEKDKLMMKVTTLEKELADARKQTNADHKTLEALNRDKEIIAKAAQKAAAYSQEQQRLISLQELHKKKLQEELQDLNEQLKRQKHELATLQTEKERLLAESVDLNNQVQDYIEDVKLKQMEVYDYKKKVAETDAKMKMQMTLFEQVRSERNQLSKGLVEAQDEINELKHKLKVKSYQVEQLKEDITTKENQLLKEEFALQKLTKEKEAIRMDLQKSNNELRDCKDRIQVLTQEENRLQKIIQEGDKERTRLTKELNQVSNERDILGTQLVRRNDELSLLYEKVKILQCTLNKGEAQYDQRLEDVRLLKIEIKRLRQEKAMLARSMNNLSDLRQEIFHLERDFTRERLKCRALEEELQNPLNVHRWRKLEGSDPTTYELIQKIQILQKRLLSSSEEAIKRESQLKETERLYMNLRQLLARQPGPETFEKLKKTQHALRERGMKMKCMVAELTMYESQVSDYKFEMEQLNKELADLKKKYFEMKRREQKVKQKEKELAQEKSYLPVLEPITGNASKAKFIGGGFNVAAPCTRIPSISTNA